MNFLCIRLEKLNYNLSIRVVRHIHSKIVFNVFESYLKYKYNLKLPPLENGQHTLSFISLQTKIAWHLPQFICREKIPACAWNIPGLFRINFFNLSFALYQTFMHNHTLFIPQHQPFTLLTSPGVYHPEQPSHTLSQSFSLS